MSNKKKILAGLALLALLGSYPAYKALKGPQTMSLLAGGSIESGQIVTGNIPNPTTIDTYSFEATAGDTITVRVSEVGAATTFSPHLVLRKPNGTALTQASGTLYADRQATNITPTGTWTLALDGVPGVKSIDVPVSHADFQGAMDRVMKEIAAGTP